MKDELVFINKRIIPAEQAGISVLDRGLMFGWGLFETIRIYNGKPFMLYEHIRRMMTSAGLLNISMCMDENEIARQVGIFIESAGIHNMVLKIILTKGVDNVSNIIFTYRTVSYSDNDYKRGFSSTISKIRRNVFSPLTFMKTLNYMDNIIAKQEATEAGCDEAIILNTRDRLCEGSMSNVFFIKNNRLYTPNVGNGLLPGIVRQAVIDKIAPAIGMEVFQGEFDSAQLIEADEAFLTNSVMQVMPLVSVDGKVIGSGTPGTVTASIIEAYNLCVQQHYV